mmetsp:Transcript_66103/g.145002  ORF Transcript_66103/g.145002 Transcript_66103/m.145002 type:complete len:221 (-) Transcript_66103:101-763(-)
MAPSRHPSNWTLAALALQAAAGGWGMESMEVTAPGLRPSPAVPAVPNPHLPLRCGPSPSHRGVCRAPLFGSGHPPPGTGGWPDPEAGTRDPAVQGSSAAAARTRANPRQNWRCGGPAPPISSPPPDVRRCVVTPRPAPHNRWSDSKHRSSGHTAGTRWTWGWHEAFLWLPAREQLQSWLAGLGAVSKLQAARKTSGLRLPENSQLPTRSCRVGKRSWPSP